MQSPSRATAGQYDPTCPPPHPPFLPARRRGCQTNALRALIAQELPGVIEIRRDLHAHPELAYQERRTARVVCEELTRLGIRHVTGLAGGTGVLAFIPATTAHSASETPCAADINGLPIEENTGTSYTSTVAGCMHACGHDGHTANLLGVARVLCRLEHRPNPVQLIFQPAEEGGGGGERMCQEGCLNGALLGPREADLRAARLAAVRGRHRRFASGTAAGGHR